MTHYCSKCRMSFGIKKAQGIVERLKCPDCGLRFCAPSFGKPGVCGLPVYITPEEHERQTQ